MTRAFAVAAAVVTLAACPARKPVDHTTAVAANAPTTTTTTSVVPQAGDVTEGLDRVLTDSTSTTARASRSRSATTTTTTRRARPAVAATADGTTRVNSTAYCLTGTMANGRRAHWGAVAMNGPTFGTRYEVLDGPFAGHTFVVSDRIGHSSQFDIAMPGNCTGAINYGRRTITIRRVG